MSSWRAAHAQARSTPASMTLLDQRILRPVLCVACQSLSIAANAPAELRLRLVPVPWTTLGGENCVFSSLWSSTFKTNTESWKKLGYLGNTLPNQGFDPRFFVLSGLPDVISSFGCQSRWHSGRAGWLAQIVYGSLGEFEGASPHNLRPQAAKRPRERRSQRAALRSAPTHGGG
jgi:hypothetical protein